MRTCVPCQATKGLIKEITSHIKNMSLKAVRVQSPRKPQCAEAAPAMEAGEAFEEQEKDWIAEPEPGVLITLVPLPKGGNSIKKIGFSKELFDALGAQKWWSENYDKIMELYSITPSQSCETPAASDDEPTGSLEAQESIEPLHSSGSSDSSSKMQKSESSSHAIVEELPATTGAMEIQGKVLEWVVEDEPGVFVAVRSMPNGSREILRVELSRERFGEVKARVWWEENKARLQQQYS